MKAARPTISLVIADDHPIVLEGIVGVLSAESDLRVLAQCRTGLRGATRDQRISSPILQCLISPCLSLMASRF